MDDTLPPVPLAHNPARLLRLFTLLSVGSVAVILVVAGFGMIRLFSLQMIRDAENDAVAVGEAIFSQERESLLERGAGGVERIAVAPGRFDALDGRMREFLHPFSIYKIKVFSHEKAVVYSTDLSIVGRIDSANAKLDAVLEHGVVDSKLERKDKVRDLADEARFEVDVVETYIPIRSGERIIGSFELYIDVTRTRAKIAALAASSLGVLATILLVVFGSLYVPMRQGMQRLKQAQDELRVLANTDTLTGLFNRRFLFSRIEEEFSRMKRDRERRLPVETLALVMIDIDHFKRINDEFGHLAGDEILRRIPARLRQCLRNYDVVGRYGGEEFLVMLPHTSLAGAREVADRLHRSVREHPFMFGTIPIQVTVSVGASLAEDGDQGALDAIHRADAALYLAKNAGRDRVAWHPA